VTPLAAAQALDDYFLEARSKLLDLAAILDRIDRGADVTKLRSDPRLSHLRQAIDLLGKPESERAAHIQEIFSLPYDPDWKRPTPR
jgi:hypothetical protein